MGVFGNGGKQGDGSLRVPLAFPGDSEQGSAVERQGKSESGVSKARKGAWLAIYAVGLLVSSVVSTVYFKKVTMAMPSYTWYLTQVLPIPFLFIFGLTAGPPMLMQQSRELISRFAVMGLLDGSSTILMVLGTVRTSGTMQVLLGQLLVPFVLVFSILILGKSFHCLQYVGSVAIACGVVAAKFLLGEEDTPDGSGDGSGASSAAALNDPVFGVLFVLGLLPQAFSAIIKEIAFRGPNVDLDTNVLQFWVTVFQVLTNCIAAPIYSLSLLGPQQVALSDMPDLAVEGSACLLLGRRESVRPCGWEGEQPCDECGGAWQAVTIFFVFNIAANVLMMLVIKHGSAALLFLVSTLQVPLASVAFSSSLIMGAGAVPLRSSDVLGLLIILLGLAMYRLGGRLLKQQARGQAGEGTAGAVGSGSVDSRMQPLEGSLAPMVAAGMPVVQPNVVFVPRHVPQPRSAERVRSDFYCRLGAASPLQSPHLRHMSQTPTPTRREVQRGPSLYLQT